jgi:medium-chain acyl-[acyl-carrier-protein] hydrolase
VSGAGPSWVRRAARRRPARLTLFCLPFAGGGAAAFRDWPRLLPPDVEVCPVHLPGREDRFREPAIVQVDVLADELLEGLAPHIDRPFGLFGHSMGGLIAFELARRLRGAGFEPSWFFASGSTAPHLPRRGPTRHRLPQDEFVAAIRELNGVPPALVDNPEVMDLMLPTLRRDFTLVETYRYRPKAPLPCPVVVFGGRDDPEVAPEDLEAWREHAAGRFEVHVLPGDHFFLATSQAALLRLVGERLGDGRRA